MIKFIFVLTLIINTSAVSKEFNKAYFGGGCFWCMEESFEKVEGVIEVISGYSGGKTNNPTYREVTYGDSGHFETVEVIFDNSKTDYETLLKVFWVNIDPFDALGQFCDKGYSYRSVAFYQNENQKKLIDNSILSIEKKFNQELDALMLFASIIEAVLPKTRRLKLIEVVHLLKEITTIEMDLRFEASAASELKKNTISDPKFEVPKIAQESKTKRTLDDLFKEEDTKTKNEKGVDSSSSKYVPPSIRKGNNKNEEEERNRRDL